MAVQRITSVRFSRYKAFESFQLALNEFNVLVGPNNAGKSTIIGAFRILAEGLRKARSRNAEPIEATGFTGWGYRLNIADLPIASENIFFDYDDSSPAQVTFRLSNGNHLKLYFPEQGTCYLIPETQKRIPRTTSQFKAEFDVEIGFVPILGPVEQKERLYEKEAARLALLTSGASRNFRNIWYHFPADFDRFRELIKSTWPGMDIDPPEHAAEHRQLVMFCPEERRASSQRALLVRLRIPGLVSDAHLYCQVGLCKHPCHRRARHIPSFGSSATAGGLAARARA